MMKNYSLLLLIYFLGCVTYPYDSKIILTQGNHKSFGSIKSEYSKNQTKQNSHKLFSLTLIKIPDGFKNALASGLSSIIVKSALQPFDTIKTVQQASLTKLSPIDAFMFTIKRKGIQGLWSGITSTVMGSAPSSAVYFGIYSSTKTFLSSTSDTKVNLFIVAVSAAIANTFASIIRAPFEVLKQRIQTGAHKTTWDALIYSIQRDGIFGLFSKGKLASQIARDVPYSIVVLISYELLQNAVKIFLLQHVDENHTKLKVINNELHSSYNRTSIVDNRFYYGHILHYPRKVLLVVCRNRRLRDALCGSIAGGFGSLFTNPMDVVKTRLMTDTQYQSVITAVYHIYRKEGLATFFRGSMPRLLHKIPANALFFLCYESLRSLLGVPMTKS